jgi:hypothetical protein
MRFVMTHARAVLLCLVLLAVVAMGALAAGGTPTATDSQSSVPQRGQSPVAEVEPEQQASFSVLRRGRRADDELPAKAAEAVAGGPSGDLGANAGLARRAGSSTAAELYVVPARGFLCLVTADGVASCNRSQAARDGYVVSARSTGPGITGLAGMVPDGVRSVHVVGEGHDVEVATEANTWALNVDFAPAAVRWSDGGVEAEVPVHAPPAPSG